MLGGPLVGISLFFGITAGSYFGYQILRPKNLGEYLVWKDYRLIQDDSTWNATYLDYGFNEFKNIQELKSFCSKALNKYDFQELQKVIEYCVDEIRTVKSQLIREGTIDNLMKSEEEYELSLLLRSENKEFLEMVNNIEKYKEWCASNLKKSPTESAIKNTKTFCISKPYKTASEKLKQEGFKRLTKSELSEKYEELKIVELGKNSTNTLLADISENNNLFELRDDKDNKHEKFAEAYWKWCEKEGNKSLLEKDFYPQGYSKFKSRCVNVERLKEIKRKSEEIRKINPFVQEVLAFEKDNNCDIYFSKLKATNSYYKVDDPIWISHRDTREYERIFGKRNIYETFAKLVRNPRTKGICKNLNGKRYLSDWQWREKAWS